MFFILNSDKVNAYIVLLSSVAILLMFSVIIHHNRINNDIQASSMTYENKINDEYL